MMFTDARHEYVQLAKLTPSPLNHRKRFDKKKMDELAESIRAQGIVVPLLVRPFNGDGSFEVVAGERRYRAAKIVGLAEVPVMIREIDDAKALELQVIENQQREDVHPIEEAEGYEALLACTHPDGRKYSVDDLVAKLGKSKGYVYARLKLTALCQEARKAFYDDAIDASKALLIARIAHPDTQRQALKDISQGIRGHGPKEPMSYRDAHKHILQTYMLKLAAAPFDIKDAELLPKAGDCIKCPKRTGNQADLFDDVKSADVCTDPKCFDEKRQAHYGKAVKELEAQGKKVIHGDDAKRAFPDWDSTPDYSRDRLVERYVPLSGHTYVGFNQRPVRDVVGKDYEPLLIQHPGTGKVIEVATLQAVQAAGQRTAKGTSGAKSKSSTKAAKPKGPDIDDVLTERLAKLVHEKAPKLEFGRTWLLALAREFCQHLSMRDLDAVALAWGWKANAFKSGYGRKLPVEASKLSARDLVLLMFDMVFAIGAYSRGSVLKLFEINEQQIREQIIEERKKARAIAKLGTANPQKKAAPAKATPKKKAAARAAKPGKKAKRTPDFMKPMTPRGPLVAIVGDKPLARTEVTSKLWGYIKKNGLQDKTNRRMINADEKLRPLFGNKKQASMFEMTKFVAKHLAPAR